MLLLLGTSDESTERICMCLLATCWTLAEHYLLGFPPSLQDHPEAMFWTRRALHPPSHHPPPTTHGPRYGSMRGLTSHHSNHLWVISRENRQLSSTILCLALQPDFPSQHPLVCKSFHAAGSASANAPPSGRFLQWRVSSILVWQVQVQLQQCNFTSGRALSRAHSAVVSSTMPCRNL